MRPAVGAKVSEDFVLAESAAAIGDVVVTGASRRAERLTESPATISVISGAELEAIPGASYEQALATVKGVDFVRAAVSGFGINARGFNSAFNTKMLLLTDGRRQMLPGAGLPFANMNPVIKEDVDRVEVILGPSSALYGANAHNGIVNVITKDPRNTPGLTVVGEGGGGGEESALSSARGRYAQGFADNRFALKVTGEYTGGQDFDFRDSVYVNVPAATPEDPDFDVEHLRGQAELYASPVADTDVVLSYAGSQNSFLGVTNLGRNQIEDWTLQQLQARVVQPRVFAQVYRTWSNSGNTYALQNFAVFNTFQDEATARQSARFIDKSRKTNAEVQGNVELYGFRLIAGADYEWERAVSEGTYLSDTTGVGGLEFEQRGISGQAEYDLTRRLRLVAAREDFPDYAAANAASVAGMLDGPVFDRLGEVAVPTLVLYGADDALIPNRHLHPTLTTAAVAESAGAAIPCAEVHLVEGAGHLVMLERPEAVHAHLVRFLAE